MRTFSRKVAVLFSIAAAPFLTAACGGSDSSSGTAPVVLPERVFNPPAEYALADEGCQRLAAPVQLTRTTIPAWQGDEVNMIPVGLTNTLSAESLRNGIVKDTVFGVAYERRCDAAKGDKACLDQFGREKDYEPKTGTGWYLRVCNDNHAYDRKSVETVALASAHYLDLAHRKYLALKESSAAVPEQVLLNVLPLFTDVHDNYYENGEQKIKKAYIVNNLAYYGSKRMVIVFPPSKQVDRLDPGYFWESQFVLGHEYGHHIERQRTGFLTEHLGVRWNPLSHSWEDGEHLMLTGNGQTEFTQMLGTVSEGFADLLAFYAEGGTAFSLSGIPRLGPNRDIRLATFANQDEKILTQERFNLLTGRAQATDGGADSAYTDIHVGGAIIAHTADKIFKAASLARADIEEGSNADMDYRYKLVLRWIDEVGDGLSLTKDEGADAQLAKLSDAFATVVNESVAGFQLRHDVSEKDLRSEVCTVLKDSLPVLAKPAFYLGSGC